MNALFSKEIKVNGDYVSGTIKRNEGNKNNESKAFLLHSGLNFGNRSTTVWTSEDLINIINELQDVVNELDKHNGQMKV